jgi:hypothetical protein
MAFVLQNDPNGTTASAKVSSSSIIGETLGVWGVDTNNKLQDGDEFAKTAIQNSWALEFDTYTNTSTGYSDAGKGDSPLMMGSRNNTLRPGTLVAGEPV